MLLDQANPHFGIFWKMPATFLNMFHSIRRHPIRPAAARSQRLDWRAVEDPQCSSSCPEPDPWAKIATCGALMGRSQLGRDLYEGVPLLSRSATASRLNRSVNPRLVFVIEHLPARQERIRSIRQTALPHFAEKSLNGNRRYNQAAWLITSGGKRGRAERG
jgi:hypothetical protein